MTIQSVSGVPTRTAERTPEPELYDFAKPNTLPRDRASALLKGTETFARSWATDLSAKLGSPCQVAVLSVTAMAYDDYIARLPEATAMVLCSIEAVLPRAVVQLPLGGMLGWASLMLGARSVRDIPERPFSAVEQAVVTRVVSGALTTLAYSLGPAFPEGVKVERIEYTPQAAKAAGPTDATIVTTLELTLDGTSSTITIAMPAAALGDEEHESSVIGDGNPLELMLGHLADVPVRVSLQFQATRVRPETVLGLAEGDLIRITHSKNRPLNVAVEGQVMAKAAVGASGSQLACVIVDTQETP